MYHSIPSSAPSHSAVPSACRRARFFLATAVVFIGAQLRAQSPGTPAVATIINDAAWNGSTSVDFSRARLTARTARLTNVSIRAKAGSGANTLIAGAVVQGSGTLPMLVRAVGPGLTRFGVTNALRDPKLEIFRSESLAAQTTTGTAPTAASAYVGAFPLTASSQSTPGDAALLGEASAGTFTAHCTSTTDTSGVALLEFYDAASAPASTDARFVNLSSRAIVESGEGLMVVGFVVAGEGNVTLLLRGIGATLAQFGVAGTLRDPTIELYSGNTRIAANDDWQSGGAEAAGRVQDAQLAVGAFALTSPSDAAMVVTLPAGAYTLQVRGTAGQSGVALAEISEVLQGDFDAAQATNSLGLDLFRELSKTTAGKNLIISPYSIESAFAMAYAGAEGGTREEMGRVLRLPADTTPVQLGFAALRRGLEQIAVDSKPLADARTRAGTKTDPIEWNAANRLFGQPNYPFRDSFLTLMRDGFDAPLQAVDFANNSERARVTINTWVEDQTRQKIQNLIPSGGVTEDTRLVLVNALYLKAPWNTPFPKSGTAPRAFHPTPTSSPEVSTMQLSGLLGYTVEDGMTVVTLDYLGRGLQLVIALPDEGLNIDAAAAKLTSSHFARWAKLGDNARRDVVLYLPKFKTDATTMSLANTFRALGMKQAFDEPMGSANFDRMAPRRPDDYLAISKVFHQTFVALDEEGTEAAAATAIGIVAVTSIAIPVAIQPIVVRVDRPFLFAIQHRASGTCLFFGRINDPR